MMDVLYLAGVDLGAEEAALDHHAAAEAGAAAGAPRQPGEVLDGDRLTQRLELLVKQCGVANIEPDAIKLMGMAVVERLRSVISALPRLAGHRLNSKRDLMANLDGGGVKITSDPRKTYRQQRAEAAKRATDEAAAAEAAAAEAAAAAAANSTGAPASSGGVPQHAQPTESQYHRDDARQLQSTLAHGAPTGAVKPAATVSVRDVLFLLESEPQSNRSRITQWWRCEGKPLPRYARRAARLFFSLDPAQKAAAPAPAASSETTSS
tara:strand:- start:219 stop:1013 length:795 start_codon:yes stop_codon:yes gene_type:complete